MSVLITGGTGFLGRKLTNRFIQSGHQVSHLSRRPIAGSVPAFAWDVSRGEFDRKALVNNRVIIHLAGAGVADKRWSSSFKQEILRSRTDSTALLHQVLEEGNHQVTTVVCASAIGYYGFEEAEQWMTEDHGPGKDFLAQVVTAWEREEDRIASLGIRLVKIRIGIVLSAQGGALVKMALPVRWGVGAALGSGNQWVSWIHEEDLCDLFLTAATDANWTGAYNGVSPHPATNRQITREIAAALGRPLWLPPVPSFVLHALVGQMAEVVLHGSRVSADKALKNGFQFKHPDLREAIGSLLGSRS